MSPEQFCGASAAHFPASSHSFSHAVKKVEEKTSCGVHFHSSYQRAERRAPGSRQSRMKQVQKTFWCCMWRNQREERRFDLFFQSQ